MHAVMRHILVGCVSGSDYITLQVFFSTFRYIKKTNADFMLYLEGVEEHAQ